MKKNRLAVTSLEREKTDPFSIFDISRAIRDIITDIVEAEIAGDTEEVEALFEALEGMHATRSEKHVSYIHVIKNAENAADGSRAQAEEHRKRAAARENLSKRLKKVLIGDLSHHGEESVIAGDFKLERKSTDSVKLHIDAEDLPVEYQRVKIEADKPELKRALKNKEKIDGVELEKTEHIQIKVH